MIAFQPDDLIPLFVFTIPIVAIAGGILAGIVRMIQNMRAFELMQRERIAAIERGLDPDKIPGLQRQVVLDQYGVVSDPHTAVQRRRQSLLISGLVLLFTGIGLALMLRVLVGGEDGNRVWAVGLVPASIGIALLLSAGIIKPTSPPPAPHA